MQEGIFESSVLAKGGDTYLSLKFTSKFGSVP